MEFLTFAPEMPVRTEAVPFPPDEANEALEALRGGRVRGAAVLVAPGPDNILVLTRGVTLGRRAALVSAAGASTGLVCHSLLAAAGLSALLARSAAAFSVVKYAGAAYLLYLGIRTLLNRDRFVLSDEASPIGLKSVFVQAVASNVLNPKIAVFFLAYLPQFADPSTGIAPQLLGLGPTFALLTWMLFSVIAFFSGGLGRWLRRRSKFASGVGWLTGGVLVGLGLRLAFSERR
ncbi:MAG: LysE family transporter [Actinomycetota bacterium]|nr:LysE family transporter [Rubrobacteraceae bacterium]MDQ3181998.1 LysE family transporter [Actinomycetota bacterium]MDQ3497920.1 LysE family transporter [Actinomycetota bacterium]